MVAEIFKAGARIRSARRERQPPGAESVGNDARRKMKAALFEISAAFVFHVLSFAVSP
jgi:hypothetical protein